MAVHVCSMSTHPGKLTELRTCAVDKINKKRDAQQPRNLNRPRGPRIRFWELILEFDWWQPHNSNFIESCMPFGARTRAHQSIHLIWTHTRITTQQKQQIMTCSILFSPNICSASRSEKPEMTSNKCVLNFEYF